MADSFADRIKEKAKKAGDPDAEERFSLPKLYAEGFSIEAKEFNCHQRAHQQAIETYANFVVCSLIGGVRQPLLTSLAGILYIVARVKWAQGCTAARLQHAHSCAWCRLQPRVASNPAVQTRPATRSTDTANPADGACTSGRV